MRSEGNAAGASWLLRVFRRRVASVDTTATDEVGRGAGLTEFAGLGEEGVGFGLAPFGQDYLLDTITIYTNTLRAETKSLYFILYSLQSRCGSLQQGDIKSFYTWYVQYHSTATNILNLIHQVYLPWLHSHSPCAHLQRTLRRPLVQRNALETSAPHTAAARLNHIFAPFAPALVAYLHHLENHLRVVPRPHFTQVECFAIGRRMFQALKESPSFRNDLVAMLRWLRDRPETSYRWRKSYLHLRDHIAYARWKRRNTPADECLHYFRHISPNPLHDYP